MPPRMSGGVKKAPRLLIISQYFPPELSASAVLLNNIFTYYTGKVYAIGGFAFGRHDLEFVPPCETEYLKPIDNYVFKRIYYKVMPRIRYINKYLMKRIVKNIKPDIIFGNYPEMEFVLNSFQIAQELHIPFYAYFHDLWEENMHKKWERKIARHWEPLIVKESRRVICCTEMQQEHYLRKYKRVTDLLVHPVPDREILKLCFIEVRNSEKRISFVGSLSRSMNQDALITLSRAIALLPREYKLYWYPLRHIPYIELDRLGFDTRKIVMREVSSAEMRKEIKVADILVAPLSFKNCSDSEVRTVFSNKILTYLVSGRPILVFGPADSYHSQKASKDGWGYVVDHDDMPFLAEQIKELCTNGGLQEELVRKAFEEAQRRRASVVAGPLLEWVTEDVGGAASHSMLG